MEELYKRFITKFDIQENGCWIWNASKTNNGYSQLRSRVHKFHGNSGHRFSYIYHKGEIPKGLEIDHLCRNRDCVNPEHLEAVTSSVNHLRGDGMKIWGKKNREKTHCPQGHIYSPENTYVLTYGGYTRRHCKICTKARDLRTRKNGDKPRNRKRKTKKQQS